MSLQQLRDKLACARARYQQVCPAQEPYFAPSRPLPRPVVWSVRAVPAQFGRRSADKALTTRP